MPLQLRDLATGEMIEVPDEGKTIGREGGQADVQLKDPGLSSRHARVFADGRDWFIQDLGSTNGTCVGEARVSETTEIHLDDVISMSKTRLEVFKVWDPKLQQTVMMAAPLFDTAPSGVAAVSRTPAARHRSGVSPAAVAPAREEEEEQEPSAAPTMIGQAAMAPTSEIAAVPSQEDEPQSQGEDPQAEEEAPQAAAGDKGLGYFLVAVPKAIAFYLAAIPLMIVNPIGTIRKGVEEQKHEAKERMELIAYALPVNLFSAAVGFIATLVVQLVTHTLSIGGLIVSLLVIPAIVAVVASAITGFVWHPLTAWIITKLKGESDPRSRTNYFLMFMTATALVVLPNGIGTILGLVPFRLVAMVQPALSALGSVVLIFVSYSWMTKFNVVKWFRTVLLVLGGLAIVGGAFGVLGRLTTAPGGSGMAATGASAADVEAQLAAAQKQTDEAMQAAGKATDEAKVVKAAVAQDAPAEADEKSPSPHPVAAEGEKPAAAEGSVSYPAYVQMRDSVEKVIADDPALLNRSPELLALYRGYTKAAFEIDAKFDALDAQNPADAKLNVRLREAELFTKTEKAVTTLYGKLKPSGQANAPQPAAREEPRAEAKPKGEPKPAPVAKAEKPKAEPTPAPAAKAEKPKAEAKPAPAAKEEKPKAEPTPAPAAKAEKPKAEPKPAPAAKAEKPKAEPKPAPAAKEEKPKAAEAKVPAGKGKLACSSKPPQADIWVDGKNTGKKTPLAVSSALELPTGKHTVLFKLNGKASAPMEITIDVDKPVVLKGIEIPGS